MNHVKTLRTLGIGWAIWLCASSAIGAPGLMARAPGCLEAADLPICLLKVLAEDDAGSDLARDRELAARPHILAAAGVTPEGVARYRTSEEGRLGEIFSFADDQAQDAFVRVLASDRAGRPPEEGLAIIAALPRDAPTLPPFFADSQETSARLTAYRFIAFADPATTTPGPPPSRALVAAVLRAWEDDLINRGGMADSLTDPSSLAGAYARHGDRDGVDRAIALEPRPDNRIRILLELGRQNEARAALARLTAADLEASVRAELTRKVGAQHQAVLEEAAAMEAMLQEEIARYGAAGQDTRMYQDLRKQNARRLAVLSKAPPSVPQRLVRSEAESRLADIRDEVLGADAPLRPDDRRLVTDAAALGLVRQQQDQPTARLRADIEQGRGLEKLDDYLATTPVAEQSKLLVTCAEASARARLFNLVAACLDRSQVGAGQNRMLFAESTIRYARNAYAFGDAATGRALLTRALSAAKDLDVQESSSVKLELVEIAKAELRASDRLPPRPKAQTMIGPAP